MVDPIKRVIVRRPDQAFSVDDPKLWHYVARPNLLKAQKEHDLFVNILEDQGIEVIYHDLSMPNHADSIFVHDPVIITKKGAIILKMGKKLREGEEDFMALKLRELKIPILYRVNENALVEGGDILWIDEHTLAIGEGYRTNIEGINQLRAILNSIGVSVVKVELPYYKGPDACLHLQSLISLIDKKIAVVYLPLLSVKFVNYLREKSFRLIEVSEKEFTEMGTNILTMSPSKVLMLSNNKKTIDTLRSQHVEIYTYDGEEISLKAEGGPTCLTRPILRGP